MRVLDMFRRPLVAIDVGTATTRVSFGAAAPLEHPSVVCEPSGDATVTRSVLRGGVVADIAGVASVVQNLLSGRLSRLRRRPAALVCAPSDASDHERDALIEAMVAAGVSVVSVVPEPLAAAIGAGVDLSSEHAVAIVDIGDGVTDIAVLRNASIVFSDAKRIGCSTLRAAIHDWLEFQHGSAVAPADESLDALVRAYCAHNVVSHTIALRSTSLRVRREDLDALVDPVIDSIASFVATTLRNLPDHLGAEIIESGIHLCGGGATLSRLVARIEARAGLPVHCATDPRNAVIRGAAEMLANARLLTTSRTAASRELPSRTRTAV